MKDETTLVERIRSVRKALRARQPLQKRIEIVRSRHQALAREKSRPNETRRVEIRLDGSR